MGAKRTTVARTVGIALLMGVWLQAGCVEDLSELTPAQQARLKDQRDRLAARPRRIIFNNDGADYPRGPETAEQFLARRLAALADTQVDTLFYGTPYAYRALTVALVNEKGTVTDKDHFQAVVEFCRQNGKEVFWSMRMNETHDSNIHGGLRLDDWKLDHREMLMARSHMPFPYGWVNRPSWPWTAMDYEHIEVRQHILEVLADVMTRYDVDGVELDFWRWPVFFRPQLYGQPVTADQREIMTDLMRNVRLLTELVSVKRNRPLLIAVRVPDSVDYAAGVGLDIEAWLAEDLVDLVVAGGLFQLQPWERTVSLVKPHGKPVYACLSRSRIPDDVEAFRGEAWDAWQAGVDGIYVFNVTDPKHSMLREIGDAKMLAALPRKTKYALGHMEWWHVQRIGTILKGGEAFFDRSLMSRWQEPWPRFDLPFNVGLEPGTDVRMVCTDDRYKLSYSERRNAYELYDMLNDPHEHQDLSQLQPDVFEAMRQRFEEWRAEHKTLLYGS